VPTCNFSRTYIQPVALGLRQVKKWVQRSRVSK
jgi:hypothetical protein